MKTFIYKNLRLTIALLALLSITFSCSSSDDQPAIPINEITGLNKIQELSNGTHTVELYAVSGALQQGYNAVSLRIKNKATGQYEKNAEITLLPVMHMAMMLHSCPVSTINKTVGKDTFYNGYIIFQMAQNDTEYWEMQVNYNIDGVDYSAMGQMNVPASDKQRVTTFTGTDGARYIIAMIDPQNPRVATNDMTVAVYKMESMMSFPIVDGYKIKIDPRMTGMGNHGSPNNTDLIQSSADHLYHGKLSLTMTGYWKINLQLLNTEGTVLKGEPVTAENPESSLYLETEF